MNQAFNHTRKHSLSRKLLIILLALLSAISAFCYASGEILTFDNNEQREVYEELILELRCPKCQNQNIADSNADLATDLREKVYVMAKENKSKIEIKQFMLARFGEFVLYEPQFSPKTWLLWLGPIFLLFFAIFICIKIVIRNATKLKIDDNAEDSESNRNYQGD